MNYQDVVMATYDVVTDTQVAATQDLMTGTQDVVDTQGTAVTDTQKTGDIIY